MEWATQQITALEKIDTWRDDVYGQQVFYLAGYAGTGKSTIAKTIGEREADRKQKNGRAGHAQFCALTGKAALVLKRKGCENAKTIHSLIYTSVEKSRDRLRELETKLAADPMNADLVEALANEKEAIKRPGWSRKEKDAVLDNWVEDEYDRPYIKSRTSLFVVDECSMVDRKIGEDMMAMGVRILVLGDPAQLPPVAGNGFFTSRKPDMLLTEIHRQALDSPVLNLACLARQGGELPLGKLGDSQVCLKTDLTQEDWMGADMILVGRNATRESFNKRLRTLKGFEGLLPQPSERLVCLRNNHKIGLLNGGLWDVVEVRDDPKAETFWMTAKCADEDRTVQCLVLKYSFLNTERPAWFDRDTENEFTFGYCLTTHKAQGSEWPHVIYYDEWTWSGRKEHVYTGITRASDRVTVVKP